MGKLVVTEFVTVDGVAQAPGAPDEDRDSGFEHGGWQAPLLDESAGAEMFERAKGMDALLLGRKTYEIFAGYWPNAPEEVPFTGLLNDVPKYVASHTLSDPLAWSGASIIEGDLGAAIGVMKERHREVHVIGSLDLLQTLLRMDLVDQLNLWIHPVVLGTGKKAFGEGAVPRALRLTESKTYPSGTVLLTYASAGDPTYGDMTEEDELRRANGA